jgi:hypothetical protein
MAMERLVCFGERETPRRAIDERTPSSLSSAAMRRLSFAPHQHQRRAKKMRRNIGKDGDDTWCLMKMNASSCTSILP